MPDALSILAIIALTLYILFGYVLPPFSSPPAPNGWRSIVSVLVIAVILIFWYILPVHIGGK